MGKIILILLILFLLGQSAESGWVPSGQMASGSDWVYAMTADRNGNLFASSWAQGIYKSTNDGQSWTFSGLQGKRVSNITSSPNGELFALTKTTSISYIHRSTDNGNTWSDVYAGSFNLNYAGGGAFVFPGDGSIVCAFAVTVGPTIGDVATFVFRSTDSGNSWNQTQVIPLGFVGGMIVTADNKILLGTSLGGVVCSVNNGLNFTSLTTFPSIYIKTILKSTDNTIYVSDAFGLNRSTDNGLSFVSAGSQNSTAYLRAAVSVSNTELFISTDDRKVFYSDDRGDNWVQVNQGLPENAYIYSFAVSKGKTFAGTSNSGAYFYDELTKIIQSNKFPQSFSLGQNFPNPFNPATEINYSISHLTNVRIFIYDILGNEVCRLVNEKQQPGEYSVTWNALDFPSGTYFCRMTAGNFSDFKQMILIK